MGVSLAQTLLDDQARLEREAVDAESRARGARDRADRQRRLISDVKAQYPEWFTDQPDHVVGDGAVQDQVHDVPQDDTKPRGREAVYQVLNASPGGALPTTKIIEELQQRDWASAVDPQGSARAALRRLEQDRRIFRTGEKVGRAHVWAVVRDEWLQDDGADRGHSEEDEVDIDWGEDDGA